MIALNPPSLAKIEAVLAPAGLLIVNSTLVEAEPQRTDVEVVGIPCTSLARASGDERYVSIVALGGLLARRPIVSPDSVREAVTVLVGDRPSLVAADLTAFMQGYQAAGGEASVSAMMTAPLEASWPAPSVHRPLGPHPPDG